SPLRLVAHCLLPSLPFALFLPFFFLSDGDHRALHSFPTRRSSDLAASFSPLAMSARMSRRRVCSVNSGLAANSSMSRFSSSRNRDRKSTRLNSSHVKISYAVFCLKKKKKKECINTSQHTKKRPR